MILQELVPHLKLTKKELTDLKNTSIARVIHRGDWLTAIKSNLHTKRVKKDLKSNGTKNAHKAKTE